MVLIFTLLSMVALCACAHKNPGSQDRFSKRIDVDYEAAKQAQDLNGIQSTFIPVNDVLSNINKGKRKFECLEWSHSANSSQSGNIPRGASSELVNMTFALHGGIKYFTLDNDDIVTSITNVTKATITVCTSMNSSKLNVGDIILATEKGPKRGPSDRHWKKASKALWTYMNRTDVRRNKDFSLLRNVTSITILPKKGANYCYLYETDDIIPIALFDSFNVNGTVYQDLTTMPQPDSNMTASGRKLLYCDPNIFNCYDGTFNFPGNFNYNYDPVSRTAINPSTNIAPGFDCKNCYIYYGTSVSYNFDYSFYYSKIQISMGILGQAGYNFDLSFDNPSFSAQQTIPLLFPSTFYNSVRLGTYVTIGAKFGGLKAIFQENVDLRGRLDIYASASGSAGFEAGYANDFFFTTTKSFTQSFSTDSQITSVSYFQVSATLQPTINIQASLSGVVTVYADLNLIPEIQYTYPDTSCGTQQASTATSFGVSFEFTQISLLGGLIDFGVGGVLGPATIIQDNQCLASNFNYLPTTTNTAPTLSTIKSTTAPSLSTIKPTMAPTLLTFAPTQPISISTRPTWNPTYIPTRFPTVPKPTIDPTIEPSLRPTFSLPSTIIQPTSAVIGLFVTQQIYGISASSLNSDVLVINALRSTIAMSFNSGVLPSEIKIISIIDSSIKRHRYLQASSNSVILDYEVALTTSSSTSYSSINNTLSDPFYSENLVAVLGPVLTSVGVPVANDIHASNPTITPHTAVSDPSTGTTTTANSSTKQSGMNSMMGIIIGVVISVVVLIVIALTYYCMKIRKSKVSQEFTMDQVFPLSPSDTPEHVTNPSFSIRR